MKRHTTTAIIIRRTNFGEADRILSLLTPDAGKQQLMARGVRKVKSKLAGGIELFSVSQVSYLLGRGEIGTLVSARLDQHYGMIVRDIERVQLGYELLRLLDRVTEDEAEPAYFDLLRHAFIALNDLTIDLLLVRLWFSAQLLRLTGHKPNLTTLADDQALSVGQAYGFDFETVRFVAQANGGYSTDDIKFLRLLFSDNRPQTLANVRGARDYLDHAQPLVQTMCQTHLRI